MIDIETQTDQFMQFLPISTKLKDIQNLLETMQDKNRQYAGKIQYLEFKASKLQQSLFRMNQRTIEIITHKKIKAIQDIQYLQLQIQKDMNDLIKLKQPTIAKKINYCESIIQHNSGVHRNSISDYLSLAHSEKVCCQHCPSMKKNCDEQQLQLSNDKSLIQSKSKINNSKSSMQQNELQKLKKKTSQLEQQNHFLRNLVYSKQQNGMRILKQVQKEMKNKNKQNI